MKLSGVYETNVCKAFRTYLVDLRSVTFLPDVTVRRVMFEIF